jgi:tetratricopeptide (TPR) repeat protein
VFNNYQDEIQKLFNKGDFRDLDEILGKLKSKFKDDIEKLIELRLIKSRYNVLIGKYQEALDDIDLILNKAKQLQNDIIIIDIYLVRCETLHFLGKYDIFIKNINLIELLIREIPQEGQSFMKQSAKLEQLKGRYHTTQGEYNKALKHLFQSKELYNKLNLNLGLARTLNLMAGIYWREGDIKKSTEILELALDIFKQLGNKKMLSLTLNNLGILNHMVGDYDFAIQNFKLALNISIKNDDIQNQGKCHMNLGYTHLIIGELDLAQTNFFESLDLNEKIKNTHDIAGCYSNLAHLASAKGNFEEAIEFFKKSIKVYKTISLGPLYLDPLVGIIIASIDFNLKSKAEEHQKELEKLFQQYGTFKIQFLKDITNAYYLKNYGNEEEIIKAKQIFIDRYEDSNIEFNWRIFCVLNYCDIIIKLSEDSNQNNTLNEIKKLMLNVLKLAKSAVSFRIFACTNLYNSRPN